MGLIENIKLSEKDISTIICGLKLVQKSEQSFCKCDTNVSLGEKDIKVRLY